MRMSFFLESKRFCDGQKSLPEHQLRIGHTILNYDALTVTTDKDTQLLPQKEFLLLYKLLSYPNQIFTRMQLMDDIWGPDSDSGDATVSVHSTVSGTAPELS